MIWPLKAQMSTMVVIAVQGTVATSTFSMSEVVGA